jgi:hypothetical protein
MSAAFSHLSIRDTKPDLVKVSTHHPPGSYRVLGKRPQYHAAPTLAISPGICYKGRDVGIRYKEPIARPKSA